MAPRSSSRRYGSVEDLAGSSRRLPAEDDDNRGTNRVSFDFDPSLSLRDEAEGVRGGGRGKRWLSVVVMGVCAIAVMMGLTHAGYRPLEAITGGSARDDPIQSLIDVGDEGIKSKRETSPEEGIASAPADFSTAKVSRTFPGAGTKAAAKAPHPRAFPKAVLPAVPRSHDEGKLPNLSFTALNFYQERDGKPALDYPWLKDVKLIEPHRDTTLAVESPRDGFQYRWKVYGGVTEDEGNLQAEATDAECVIVLSRLDDHLVVLEEVNANGDVTRRLSERVMVKYVRREIRTLTDEEREELFDAMFTLWEVRADGGNGKELYGEDYADIYAINRLHYKAASPLECDHFHDGLGFLTSHSVISNTFEFSLQKVNPKLTLPYWDFTIETSSAGASEDSSVEQSQVKSELFQESWFGTVDPSDDMVKDGRWAYTQIPPMRANNPGGIEPDVYGKLRAPWNVNNRSYLSRGFGKMCGAKSDELFPWPTCEMHYDLVTAYSDFYSWVWYSLYDPHGPVHIWIGGVMDCEKTYAEIASLVGKDIAEEFALYAFIHRKNLFREGIFSCTGIVSPDVKPMELLSSGQCGCQGYDLTQGDDYLAIYNNVVEASSLLEGFDADVIRQVMAALCTTPVTDGDHLQASSSMDPSFYATHPTMERLWMYAVLTGKIKDYTWPDSDVTITKPDGSTTSEVLSLYGETCEGHRGSDVFPYSLLDNDTDNFQVRTGVKGMEAGNTLTNRELLEVFDARTNLLPYVYDNFKWIHCESDGFDFDDAWTGTQEKSSSKIRRPQFKEGAPRIPMYKIFEEKRAARMAKRNAQA